MVPSGNINGKYQENYNEIQNSMMYDDMIMLPTNIPMDIKNLFFTEPPTYTSYNLYNHKFLEEKSA